LPTFLTPCRTRWPLLSQCDLESNLKTHHFPVFPLPARREPRRLFERTVRERIREAWQRFTERRNSGTSGEDEYRKRLLYELDVISQDGFSAYFLIVADFINYAKKRGIPVGPGRGSAAGSLWAYSWALRTLDPIRARSDFDRFLQCRADQPAGYRCRFSASTAATKSFRYVSEKYGKDRVAQITTFGAP